jgi:hypothetical protein
MPYRIPRAEANEKSGIDTDYEGETVKSAQELTMDHPQIALRKDFLKVRSVFSVSFLYMTQLCNHVRTLNVYFLFNLENDYI